MEEEISSSFNNFIAEIILPRLLLSSPGDSQSYGTRSTFSTRSSTRHFCTDKDCSRQFMIIRRKHVIKMLWRKIYSLPFQTHAISTSVFINALREFLGKFCRVLLAPPFSTRISTLQGTCEMKKAFYIIMISEKPPSCSKYCCCWWLVALRSKWILLSFIRNSAQILDDL